MNRCGSMQLINQSSRIKFLYGDMEIFCLDNLHTQWSFEDRVWGIHKWVYNKNELDEVMFDLDDKDDHSMDTYTIIIDGVDEI